MNSPLANRSQDQTFSAVAMGASAMVWAWSVLYPSRHAGFTGTPLLVAFEAVKAIVLLLILVRGYTQNTVDDGAVRANRVYAFTRAAAVSTLLDMGIISLSGKPIPER